MIRIVENKRRNREFPHVVVLLVAADDVHQSSAFASKSEKPHRLFLFEFMDILPSTHLLLLQCKVAVFFVNPTYPF